MGIKDQINKDGIRYVDIFRSATKDDLSQQHLSALGTAYLLAYPTERHKFNFGLFKTGKHSNQAFARELINFNEDPESAWITLANIYKRLPNDKGCLAVEIKELFINKLGLKTMPPVNSPYGCTTEYPQRYLAEHMLTLIERHFTPSYTANIELTSQNSNTAPEPLSEQGSGSNPALQ